MHILIIGCGGIGSWLAAPLLRYLQAENFKGKAMFVDGDKFTADNAARQDFVEQHISCFKAESLHERYRHLFPLLDLEHRNEFVGETNIGDIVREGDIVFLCVDNHACRRIVEQHLLTLKKAALISGGNELKDGNVQLFIRRNSKNITPALSERHPELLTADDGDRSRMSCEELAALPGSGQIIFTNFTAAAMMLNLFWKLKKGRTDTAEVYFDIEKPAARAVGRKEVRSHEPRRSCNSVSRSR